jgi:peptidoglycan hydrolase-like protein with peptidoglycan-binding domain
MDDDAARVRTTRARQEMSMNVTPWKTVSIGETSDRTRGIQFLLRAQGLSLAADGHFGPLTEKAVESFQSASGLDADGVVGPRTWSTLVIATHLGSTGDAVRALQWQRFIIIPEEEPLVVDGVFGAVTEDRVRRFQDQWGLTQDGVAGRETWSFATAVYPWPLVKLGATSATNYRVLTVQHLLRAHGAAIVADGSYGPATGEAMRQFQLAHRARDISTTCGQLDWPDLVVTVRPGSHGEAVMAVQNLLSVAVDGVFGPATAQAVRDFQSMFGFVVDGIVGPRTWEGLVKPVFE